MTRSLSLLIIIVLSTAELAYGQTLYSVMSGETGNMSQWSTVIRDMNTGGNSNYPTSSQNRVKNGSWAYKFEMPNPNVSTCCDWNYTMVHSYSPNLKSMGSPNGRYLSGYYSFWLYIDEGFTPGLTGSDDWMTILNWFSGAPINPILNIELRRPPGQRLAPLQLVFLLKNAHTGCYAAPQISGYNLVGGAYYFMTAASPAGIVEFPRFQWVHVEIYYKMASSNGQVTIWQDGVKIMDMTHSNLNTLIASSNCANTAGDMFPQFGMYSGPRTEVQRFYLDDFKVSDVRLSPSGTGSSIALPAPSSLQVQ